MAPSRPPPVDEPPSASSSEEEEEEEEEESDETTMVNQKPTKDLSDDEEGDEEEEEETDDDEEIPQPTVNKHNEKKPIPAQLSLPIESEEEEDDEEEGTESEDFDMQAVPSPSISNFTIKPSTTSKPVDESSTKSKKSSGKADPHHPTTTITQARSSSKRPLESSSKENGKGSPKKRKGISSNGAEEKSGTNRLWSENDQIAILKGMIDYQSNKGADPLADATVFHDMMKKSLHVDVSRGQMVDKIRRMRKKYLNNAEKGENGQDPVFSKPYESQSFELSKRIWGVNGDTVAANNNKVSNGSRRKVKNKVKNENPQTTPQENGIMNVEMEEEEVKNEAKEEDEEDFWKKYPLLNNSLSHWTQVDSPVVGEEFGKKAMRSIGNSNAKELEEQWKKLKVEEIELYMKKMDLMYQQTKMIQQTLK